MEFVFEDTEQEKVRRPYTSSASNINQGSMWSAPATTSNNSVTRRKSVPSSMAEVEIAPTPRRKRKTAKPNYLKSTKTPKRKTKRSSEKFTWTWNKVGWMICLGLFLRLIFMDRGVLHYYEMQDTLKEKTHELEMVIEENIELVSEIHQIKSSPTYQKKMAREHLGVIAKDEYLILFAKDGSLRSI